METSQDLESFLSRFQGEVESEGTFSVALDKAMHKLQQFQLERPEFFVVELLAVAVLGGATRFEARTSGQRLEFEFDGEPFPGSVLESLDDHAFLGSPDRHLRRLAIALRAVQTMNPSEVVFTSQGPEETATWRYRKGSSVSSEQNGSSTSHNRLEVTLRAGIRALFGGPVPSLRSLLRSCSMAPLQLRVDGAALSQALPNTDLSVALVHPEVPLPADWEQAAGNQKSLKDWGGPPFSAFVYVADTQPRRLNFLVDGIALESNQSLLGGKYIQAVVLYPGARLDLSHSSVLENAGFLEVVGALQRHAREKVVDHTKSAPRRHLPHYWNQLVRETRAYFEEAGEAEVAARLEVWIEEGRRQSQAGLQGAIERPRAVLPKFESGQSTSVFDTRNRSDRIAQPDWLGPEFARELERDGFHRDAQRVRHNFALLAADMLMDTGDWAKAREICERAIPEMGQPALAELRALFQQLLSFRPDLPDYVKALDEGDVDRAITLLRRGDQLLVLAECLDLKRDRASRREALQLRLRFPPESPDPVLRYLHRELMARRARGVVSFLGWARLSLMVSWAEKSLSCSRSWMLLPSAVREALLGAKPGQEAIAELERAVEQYRIPREVAGYCYTRILFEYRRWDEPERSREHYLGILTRQILRTLQGQIRTLRDRLVRV